ncbi:hypothetical protein F442_17064 [Phytophthora nicotianae P10297]|uniref:RING-type domain-containing protein n=2 Tax=Phytophthora nicotianae TaxID=4792 RepID=W2YKA0_PHYNI|nr:hypothetical protein F442_17064 [Phytophthora nicotianae P10297]KUF84273.1 E3 ubiquitin-protein ligase RING2 [Phytophthora nicotianae]KUF92437.1 MAP kinase-activated protein kinase 2 [Phytophthora nicotianae]
MEPSPPQKPYTFTREDYDNLVARTPNCQISKRSKYEEIELVDDCTLFDIYCQPRAPVTDPNVTKTLSIQQLNADLTCPICRGIMKDTMVVMGCLHRFCGECILAVMLDPQSKNECPNCRTHIPTKRSLRPDSNFDALIHTIYPNLTEFENQIVEQLNQTRAPPVGEKRSSPGGGSPNDTAPSSAAASEDETARKKPKVAASKSTDTAVDRVNFRVLLHEEEQPNAPKLERTLFTTSPKLKIRHLKKHLAALLKLDKYDNIYIVLPVVNYTLSGLSESAKARESTDAAMRQDLLCDQELEYFMTLKDIYDQYGMGTAWELRLLYHFSQSTIVDGVVRLVG